MYELIDDPSYEKFMSVFSEIALEMDIAKNSRPRENIVVIWLFAGHGILQDGGQTMVLNEYDPYT